MRTSFVACKASLPTFASMPFLALVLTLILTAGPMAAHAFDAESTLYTFSGFPAPSQLIQASDGNFYGTVPTGGTSSAGYVFKLTTGGVESVVYNFTNGADGGAPMASLIEGNDGNLYGTTTSGASGHGALFRLTLGGAITVLHPFAAGDGAAAGALIQNNAGDFFGAASSGGGSNAGTVFEYSHTSVFSVVHTFTGLAGDGSSPNTQLLQASDGFLYGATRRGGTAAAGSFFRFNPATAGSFVTFSSIPGTEMGDPDYNPSFGMTEAADGSLYGLTAEGGTGYGVIYKITPGSTPSVNLSGFQFVSFPDGGQPESGLFLGGDHVLYGTTSAYGPGASGATGPPNGTIFSYNPSSSSFSTLYAFSSPGGDASGTPLEGADGKFYGPVANLIYKLTPAATVPPPIALTSTAASVTLGGSFTLDWQVNNAFSQTAENCYAHGSWSGSKSTSGSQGITPSAAGTYTYALTCGGVESALTTVTVTPVVSTVVATPVITPNGGSFTAPIDYNITDATSGAVIHYTTDGSTPTPASATWGGIPLVLLHSETVKAIAVKTGYTESSIAKAVFTITTSPSTTCTISYESGFTTLTGLQLNHGATVASSILNLTHNLTNENTSAFTKVRVPVQVFASDFSFRFEKATTKSGDGLTFTVQADADTVVGTNGKGLGYATIPNSMGLKFDLVNDAGEGVNSVGLYFGGALPTVPAIDLTPSGVNLHSGDVMDAYVTYDGLYLTLQLTDTVTSKTFKQNFKLPSANPFNAKNAFFGFTGSSDTSVSLAQVLTWGVNSAGPCVTP